MRLWSLHPHYLDRQGLLAVWREGLLAKAVLSGETKGYKNHPQLVRFKDKKEPIKSINAYLKWILSEAFERGYHFDESKIGPAKHDFIDVSGGQLEYEWNHLQKKLKIRDPKKWKSNQSVTKIEPHPLFRIIKGPIASWEIQKPS